MNAPSHPTRSLSDCLLRPESVAIVGASANLKKNNSRPQRFLEKHGFPGAVYPINPGYETLFDAPCYPDLDSVAGQVEHAYVMTPTASIESVVDQCVAAGVRCASIFTGGFAETGPEGEAMQHRLVEKAAAGGLRLLGPNSLGVINTRHPMTLSANAVLARDSVPAGRIGLVSQSGSLIGALVSRGQARGIHYSTLFLETLRHREALEEAAWKAHKAGKPIMAYVLGRSELGRSLAQSHTGALAGEGAAMSAFLSDMGFLRADLFETLIEGAPLLAGRKPPAGRRVAVVTTTGGGGALVADHLGDRGVTVVEPPETLRVALSEQGLDIGHGRVIDLTMAGTREETVDACLKTLIDAPEVDAVAMVVGSSSEFYPELAVKPLAKWAHADKPVVAFLFPNAEASLRLLADAGIAAFRTPEACADALDAYLSWQAPRDRSAAALPDSVVQALTGRTGALNESAALDLFAALGVSVPECHVMQPGDSAPAGLSYPVVAKILSDQIAHKSDVGGVRVGLACAETLETAAREIAASVAAALPDVRPEGILVQPMAQGLGEAIVGYHVDPSAGPVVIVGIGGVLAETYGDVALRTAPVDKGTALQMIEEVRGLSPLRGARGHALGDLDSLAEIVVALSRLALARDVAEAEINPVIVRAKGAGALAVDGFVRLEEQIHG